jgi:hypothetical protein
MKRPSFQTVAAAMCLGLAACTSVNGPVGPTGPYGLAFLLPSSSAVSPSQFDSYQAARDALEKAVPYKTTLGELKALGFDPYDSVNVAIIPYPEVVSRLVPYSGVPLELLDPGVRDCILAQNRCKAYLFHIARNDRQRDGNFILDFLNFVRHVQVTGWSFDGMVVVRDDVVLFRNVGGAPNINTTEQTVNPLGPFQRAGESSGDLLVR